MTFRVISLAALFVVAVSSAFAQYKEPPKANTARYGNPTSTARVFQDAIYGVIKKIDATEMVLEKTKFGIDQTIKLEAKTKFIQDGKPSSLSNLKVGDQIYVVVKKNKKTGDMMAAKVLSGMGATPSP